MKTWIMETDPANAGRDPQVAWKSGKKQRRWAAGHLAMAAAGHSNSQANCESGVGMCWREWCEIRRHDVITSEIFKQKMF